VGGVLAGVCGGCGSPGGAWSRVPVHPCGVIRALPFSPLTRLDSSDDADTFAFWPPLARSQRMLWERPTVRLRVVCPPA